MKICDDANQDKNTIGLFYKICCYIMYFAKRKKNPHLDHFKLL